MSDLVYGVYDHLITRGLGRSLAEVDSDLVDRSELDPADSHEVLARHIGAIAKQALRSLPGKNDAERLHAQVELANQIIAQIVEATPRAVATEELLAVPPELLAAVVPRPPAPQPVAFPGRPQIPLANGALLTNARGEPSIGSEVNKELASADSVDLLCAFIKRRGVRLMRDAAADLIARGGQLRIITTTYMGATEQHALDELARLGAEIRISYETQKTRLHAKAWLFRRASGASTAYVGSSNLSRSALVDGKEWNVRVSQLEQPGVMVKFAATFQEYWNDPSFEPYDPSNDQDRERLAKALRAEARDASPIDFTTIDIKPYPYQKEILEGLDSERIMHGRYRNLVVMATGTGKTVVAGLDYRRLRAGGVDSLLFVAHQQRILEQSRSVFRHVLADGTFGELLVGGHRPSDWRHVFASVQSLHRLNLNEIDPARFDMVIVDEFHHAEAATYRKILEVLRPKILLGLTATPERADGQDIRHWFDGHTAVELRLWEALERELLSPFQYFGIHDEVDLKRVEWKRGRGYDVGQLESAYTDNDARVGIILRALDDTVDAQTMRALGFCVGIAHADFMAERFRRAGIAAVALHSQVGTEEQQEAISRLKRGELKILFTVDLFNEGVDLPTVDTILMLRPTESATIFLQQLGRGLRLSDDKPFLTVLDFIGAQHAEFRFDRRYRALTGTTRRRLLDEVAGDFPTLPAGCHIEFDRIAKQIVLDNIRQAFQLRQTGLISELRQLPDADLRTFLEETGFEIEDIYRRKAWRGWTGLREDAGVLPHGSTIDAPLSAAIGRLLHLDDPDRIAALRDIADGVQRPGRLGAMMRQTLWGRPDRHRAGMELLATLPARRDELRQVADVLEDRIDHVTKRLDPTGVNPLHLHARYTRNEICTAFGLADASNVQSGVRWFPEENADVFFVTLNKTERHYSPTTMYADRAINETLFQWESQSTTPSDSPVGQRYIHHAQEGSTVHLFLRESKEADGDLGAPPYLYAGPMTYVEHTGDRPMRIMWELSSPLPADVFHAARVAAA